MANGVEQLVKEGYRIEELTFDRGAVYKTDGEGNATKLGRVVDGAMKWEDAAPAKLKHNRP